MTAEYEKWTSAILDYGINYRDDDEPWLAVGESIVTSVWRVVGDDLLVLGTGSHAPSFTTSESKVWVLTGTLGYEYTLINTITTDSVPPRTEESIIKLVIRHAA